MNLEKLRAILDRYCHSDVTATYPALLGLPLSVVSRCMIRVEGLECDSPRGLRAALMGRAEDMLDELLAAGFWFVNYPNMEFHGHATAPTFLLTGEIVKPGEQNLIGLDVMLALGEAPLRLALGEELLP
jgi:hypothetical protein